MFRKIVLIFMLVLFLFYSNAEADCFRDCEYNPDSGLLDCLEFRELSQLDLQCTSLNKSNINGIHLRPLSRLILDNSLNLDSINFKYDYIVFSNVLGMEVEKSPLRNLNKSVLVRDSTFEFFHNDQLLKEENCSIEEYGPRSIFSTLKGLTLYRVTFERKICPYAFSTIKLNYLLLDELNGGFEFIDLELENNFKSLIKSLTIQNSIIKLNKNTFNKHIFKETISMSFNNVTILINNNVQIHEKKDTFSNLKQVKNILFKKMNLIKNSFMVEWFQYLNENLTLTTFNVNEIKKMFILVKFEENEFSINEKDFCLFKDFPHYKLVIPIFKSLLNTKETSCNCAILWLIFQSKLVANNSNYNSELYTCFTTDNKIFYKTLLSCNFDKRLREECGYYDSRMNYENYIISMAKYENVTLIGEQEVTRKNLTSKNESSSSYLFSNRFLLTLILNVFIFLIKNYKF